jgi:hypothetical protein
MSWGTCGSCIAKDSEIAHLRELVASLRKENLNLVDLRAANATFPRPQAPPPAEQKDPVEPSHASPAQVRDSLHTPADVREGRRARGPGSAVRTGRRGLKLGKMAPGLPRDDLTDCCPRDSEALGDFSLPQEGSHLPNLAYFSFLKDRMTVPFPASRAALTCGVSRVVATCAREKASPVQAPRAVTAVEDAVRRLDPVMNLKGYTVSVEQPVCSLSPRADVERSVSCRRSSSSPFQVSVVIPLRVLPELVFDRIGEHRDIPFMSGVGWGRVADSPSASISPGGFR